MHDARLGPNILGSKNHIKSWDPFKIMFWTLTYTQTSFVKISHHFEAELNLFITHIQPRKRKMDGLTTDCILFLAPKLAIQNKTLELMTFYKCIHFN